MAEKLYGKNYRKCLLHVRAHCVRGGGGRLYLKKIFEHLYVRQVEKSEIQQFTWKVTETGDETDCFEAVWESDEEAEGAHQVVQVDFSLCLQHLPLPKDIRGHNSESVFVFVLYLLFVHVWSIVIGQNISTYCVVQFQFANIYALKG